MELMVEAIPKFSAADNVLALRVRSIGRKAHLSGMQGLARENAGERLGNYPLV
jgi:hypothetical protein